MRMDGTQRGWALASVGILIASGVVYTVYAMIAPAGPRTAKRTLARADS